MMKKELFLILACFLVCSCSYNQFSAATTGSALGGMFGSSIGGLMGGYRGHQIGTAVGMTAGAAIGLAATTPKTQPQTDEEDSYCDVQYEQYDSSSEYSRQESRVNHLNDLDICDIRFADSNNNRSLDAGEHASLTMKVYNRGNTTLYNIAPIISCDNKRIQISPTAIVSELIPDRGFRYRAEIIASERLKEGTTTFTIGFKDDQNKVIKKSFRISTKK